MSEIDPDQRNAAEGLYRQWAGEAWQAAERAHGRGDDWMAGFHQERGDEHFRTAERLRNGGG